MGGISLLFYSSSCGTLPVKQFLQSFTFLDDLFWRCEAFDFPLVAALVTEGFFEDLLLSPSARILAASRIVADDASESSCFSSYCLDTLVHQNENMIWKWTLVRAVSAKQGLKKIWYRLFSSKQGTRENIPFNFDTPFSIKRTNVSSSAASNILTSDFICSNWDSESSSVEASASALFLAFMW